MNLYHLKYFSDTIKNKSLTEAARINFVSQSAVTQAIKSLEIFFECSLIEHKKRQLMLTSKGQMLFQEGEKLLNDFTLLSKKIKFSNDLSAGDVSFACTSSFAISFLQKGLKALKKNLPNISPILKINNSDIIKESLIRGEIEFGIIISDNNLKEFQVSNIQKGHFVIIAPKAGNSLDLNLMVTRKNKIEVKEYFKLYRRKFRKELINVQEIFSWEVIKSLVSSGHGRGLVPDYMVDDKIKVLDNMGKIPYQLVVIYPKNKSLSIQAQKVIDCIFNSR
jgi:DNA-binding transcriptional LysR family regulator